MTVPEQPLSKDFGPFLSALVPKQLLRRDRRQRSGRNAEEKLLIGLGGPLLPLLSALVLSILLPCLETLTSARDGG